MTDQRDYAPRGAPQHLFTCRDRRVLIEGPTRTGKTRGVLEKAVYCAMRWSQSRILLLRKTRASMTESVLQTLEDYVLPPRYSHGAKRDQRSSYVLGRNSRLVIGGLDNVDRIMSSEYDMICIFEATEVTREEVEGLLTRLSNCMMPFRQIIMDCNPGPPSCWLNVDAAPVDVDRGDYSAVQEYNGRPAPAGKMRRLLSRLQDNPRMHDGTDWTTLGREYLETLSTLSGVRRKRLLEGQWAAADGLVYEQFPEHVVVATDASGRSVHAPPLFLPSPALRVCASIDWGWSDALACLVGAESHDGSIRVVEELYTTKLALDQLAARLQVMMKRWGIGQFFCDPSRPEIIKQMRRWGIPCVPHKVKMIDTGIALVESRLNAGYLKVYSCCVNTIREAGEYEYPKDRAGDRKTVPVDKNNHAMDALRYLICGMDYGRTLAFAPQVTVEDELPEAIQRRLGQDPELLRAREAEQAAEELRRHQQSLLEGDVGWQ